MMHATRAASGIAGLLASLLLVSGWTAAASDGGTPPVPAQDLAVLSGMVDALQANGLVSDALADQARDLFAGAPGSERVKVMHWRVTEDVEVHIAAGASVPDGIFDAFATPSVAPASADSSDAAAGAIDMHVGLLTAAAGVSSKCQNDCTQAYEECQGRCSASGGTLQCTKMPAPLQPWCTEIWRVCDHVCEEAYDRCLAACGPSPAEVEQAVLASQLFMPACRPAALPAASV